MRLTDKTQSWICDVNFVLSNCARRHDEIASIQNLLLGLNRGFTFSNSGLRMSVMCIGDATSKEQWWDTLSHEIDHLQHSVMEYYGVKPGTEDAAWLQGYIMRLIVRALKND